MKCWNCDSDEGPDRMHPEAFHGDVHDDFAVCVKRLKARAEAAGTKEADAWIAVMKKHGFEPEPGVSRTEMLHAFAEWFHQKQKAFFE